MVKGVSRRVVVVRPQKGDMFEQAIFIVRDGQSVGRSAEDILHEACTIARSGMKKRRNRLLFPLLCGIAGGAAVGLAWLMTLLLL